MKARPAGDGSAEGSARQEQALALFSVMWALAAVWHVLGNPRGAGWAQALVAVGVAAVLLRPGAVGPLVGLAAAGIVLAWDEAPVIGNHWVLAALVNASILLAALVGAARRRFGDRLDMANRTFPAARLCLLGFYAFAAFAKLNSAFFDPAVSCAVYYFEESASSLGVGSITLDGASWVEWTVIAGTAAVEMAIPILLLWRRSRRVGVMVALVFHAILALDRTHQFFDFSALLFALFVLFAGDARGTWVGERVGSIRARLALRDERLPGIMHAGLVALPTSAVVLVALDALDPSTARAVGWWPWQAYAAVVIAAAWRFTRQARVPAPVRLVPHHPLFLLVPLLVVANGLTPYTEVKTGFGWNMYANLRTVDGETNHLLLPATLPLTDEQRDLVRIIDADSPALTAYRDTGYALTWRQLRSYLADHPTTSVTYQRGGRIVALRQARDLPDAVERDPVWREKLQLFRAVDLTSPERCVPTFGPAR